MSYEEKLKEAKRFYQTANPDQRYLLERLFPELREGEDERIRKELIEQVVYIIPNDDEVDSEGNVLPTYQKRIDKYRAWLEKQGTSYTKKDVDNAYIEGMAFAKNELEKQNKQILANSAKTCKDEKEPADKIEPKFHQGEWITNGDYTWKIIEVKPLDYILQSQDGNIVDDTISHVDEQFHSFTIQDAMDGDVLNSPSHHLIWIYKDNENYHACVNMNYVTENVATNGLISIPNDACPATKDERTILFSNVEKSGYEWDAEKLELKKISQRMVSAEAKEALYDKPKWDISDFRTWQYIVSDVLTKKDGIGQYIDSGECKKIAKYMQEEWSKKLSIEQTPKKLIKGEDYGIDGLYHAQRILEKTLGEVDGYQTDDGILEHQCAITAVKKLYEQKPTWSEEDKNKPNGGIVMEDFNDGNGFYKVNLAYLNKEQVEEIEELVERWDLQPKVSEDKSIISDLLDYFNEDKCLKHEVNDIVKWLKTINPQQKGWSENEINMLDNLITYLGGRKDLLEEIKRTYIDWLKSLKPQKQWKPSEEQIKALHDLNLTGNISYAGQGQVLIELYNDLKKLTE